MKEIKFCAWHPEHGMAKPFNLYWFIENSAPNDFTGQRIWPEGTIFLQYTGINDKHGKEIYSGDIVKLKRGGIVQNVPELVEFVDYGWYPWLFGSNDRYYIVSEVEIIGNIYENPELLNSENNNDNVQQMQTDTGNLDQDSNK